jgi:hypothetical protein
MAVEARDDLACIAPDATRQEHSVEVSRRLRIELVDAISQERPERLAFSLISD